MAKQFINPPEGMLDAISNGGKNWTFLIITAHELKDQKVFSRQAGGGVVAGPAIQSWKLLIADDFNYQVTHEWEKYDSMSGKLQEAIKGASKTLKDAASTVTGLGEKGGNVVEAANSAEVAKVKSDVSLVYQNTANRILTFSFDFVAWDNVKGDVFDPISALIFHSCASHGDGEASLAIKFPSVFKLHTEPGNMLNVGWAALTDVSPTYTFPWKDGYPMEAKVQLTFKELPPLYRDTMDKPIVSATSNKDSKAKAKDVLTDASKILNYGAAKKAIAEGRGTFNGLSNYTQE